VNVAVLHYDLKDLARLPLKQTVVRQNDRGTSAGFHDVDDMLNEIQLLVARLDGEVITLGSLVRSFRTEGWIGKDNVIALALD
jgi:hypothetical protein